jgi:CxxC-x17-CxxC domain-containing protein
MRDTHKSFGGKSFDHKGSNSYDEAPKMYKATCDNCGKQCQVPFKPTNGKPVYCSDCFRTMGGGSDEYKKKDSRRYNESNYDEKRMYTAVCDECGKTCEVPFKPSNNKPIYCSDCFEKKGNGTRNSQGSGDISEQLRAINTKIDKLVQLLSSE